MYQGQNMQKNYFNSESNYLFCCQIPVVLFDRREFRRKNRDVMVKDERRISRNLNYLQMQSG